MKLVVSFLLATAMILAFSSGAGAALFDRGGGLIYDDVLNVTWLQDANLAATNTFGVSGINTDGTMSWNTAQAWIAAMNAANYLGYSDWRLPTTPDAGGPFVYGWDGVQPYTYNYGYNMTTSEMGYMFYVNLGNVGLLPTNYNGLNARSPGTFGLINVGPFQNFGQPFQPTLAIPYWSGTQSVYDPNSAWYFDFYFGNLNPGDITGTLNNQFYAWAVRDGDVCDLVPIERDTTYTINSDASFTYTADYTYRNDCSFTKPVVRGFSVLFHGATVTTINFDSFTFDGEDPGYFNEYGADFPLGYIDPQEVAVPITVYYDADGYTFNGHIDAGETKTFTISYSGPAGVWSQKSINPAFPWTDQHGWWELIGDGHAGFDNFKVTVNLPSNTEQHKIMGYDPVDAGYPLISGNQIIFASSTAGGKLDEDILFKTKEPLGIPSSVICATLSHGRLPDLDLFEFHGSAGEKIKVTLAPDPSGTYKAGSAVLALFGIGVWRTDTSALPNTVSVKLPKAGTYFVTVSEKIFGGGKFSGDYCVKLESSKNAWQTFKRAW
jgi:hypothetical protein